MNPTNDFFLDKFLCHFNHGFVWCPSLFWWVLPRFSHELSTPSKMLISWRTLLNCYKVGPRHPTGLCLASIGGPKHPFQTTPPKFNSSPRKNDIGRLLSIWDGLFSGAMLNFQGVQVHSRTPVFERGPIENFHKPYRGWPT